MCACVCLCERVSLPTYPVLACTHKRSLKAASFEASPALDASDTLLVRFDGLGVFQMHARQHVRRLLFQDFTPSAEASMEPRLPA